jgi:hypothetical protein
MIKLGM